MSQFRPILRVIFVGAALAVSSVLTACADASHAAPPAHKPETVAAPVPVAHIDDFPGKEEIAKLFEEWNVILQTGSPHDVAALYAEDGVLLPTNSNESRTNRVEIAEYFNDFQRLRPRATINEQYIEVLDRNTAVASGVYTFDIVREGRADFIVARYNFVYEKLNGKWRIVSHHSSMMPQQMDERPMALAAVVAHGEVEKAKGGNSAEKSANDDHGKTDHGGADQGGANPTKAAAGH